jgi:hypothetical protein
MSPPPAYHARTLLPVYLQTAGFSKLVPFRLMYSTYKGQEGEEG